uniref:Major facilitator superfamily (MFS) profile domain-containing protein n=1 Tax=Glossina palpalis gambiensis TaxID=67801 RepID=A0A1B0B811_9MUSC
MPSLKSDGVLKEQSTINTETSTALNSPKWYNELNLHTAKAKSKISKAFFLEAFSKDSYELSLTKQSKEFFQQRYAGHNDDDFYDYKNAQKTSSIFNIEGADGRTMITVSKKKENLLTFPSNLQSQENKSTKGFYSVFKVLRRSSRLVLIAVTMALLIENMLLTTVVPVVPGYLYDIRHPDAPFGSLPTSLMSYKASSYSLQSGDDDGNYSLPSSEISTLHPDGNKTSPFEMENRHNELVDETMEMGYLLASKAFVQFLANPIVGPLTQRIGSNIPMFFGYFILFTSSLMFAFGRTYWILFVARAIQGIGSSCCSVCGMAMLAASYTDERERGNAMAIALGGLALGVLIGPSFGGVMYEFLGKSAPFLILSVLTFIVAIFHFSILQPKVQKAKQEPPTLKALITDPYIIVTVIALMIANMGVAVMEPSLPLWMVDTFGSSRWEQGVVFFPTCLAYIIGTHVFGRLAYKIGRWLAALLGLIVIGVSLMTTPIATSIVLLIAPNAGVGIGFAMVESSMMPQLSYLADIRHTAVYGGVYAIGDMAFCIAFIVGPILSGSLIKAVGFTWTLRGVAIICFLYAPFLTLLKNPPRREQKKAVVQVAATSKTTISVDHPPIPIIKDITNVA